MFKKSLSKEDERTVQWLTEDSGGHKAIKSIILHKHLKQDIQYLTRTVNTTTVFPLIEDRSYIFLLTSNGGLILEGVL